MDLSAAHLHLLLNHFPTVGFVIATGLLVAGLATRSDHLKVASLVTMVGIALLTIPVFVTGSAAQTQICLGVDVPGPCPDEAISRVLIEMHEGVAFIALIFIVFTGGLAWLGLWQHRRIQRIPQWNLVLVVLLTLATLGTVTQAANLGGEIRHTEIRITEEATEPPLGRQIANYIALSPSSFASLETLHMIGLTLLIGVVLLIDLKLLGYLPSVPYATVDRLLPWGILGFGLNAITGMTLFVGATYQYVDNPAFEWKVGFLMAAGLNMLFFTFDPAWKREGQPAPARSKALAVTALALWVGVMFWGSMLPFIGQAF